MRPTKRYMISTLVIITILLIFYKFILRSISHQDAVILFDEHLVGLRKYQSDDPYVKSHLSSIWAIDGDEQLFEAQLPSLERILNDVTDNDSESEVSTKENLHLMDYINSPVRVEPFDFNRCRMSNCFNFSRCNHVGPVKVHIIESLDKREQTYNDTSGESNQIYQSILNVVRTSDHYEPDPNKACLFILEDDTLDRDPLSKSYRADLYDLFGQSNDYGMNFLVFNFYSGTWPNYREDDFSGLQFKAAIVAKASNSITHHRPGFDISLPLFSHLHPYSVVEDDYLENNDIEDDDRIYLLTFKGKRYVFGGGSETRNSIYHLDNKNDIIMLTTCRHGKKWMESSDGRCAGDEEAYDRYDFIELMKKSLYCLVPRGRRLGSFRYLEALSHGCVPVILSDGFVKPFDELIDWSCASIQFPEAFLLQVPDRLKDINLEELTKMRKNCRSLYERYFSSVEKIILTTLSIIEQRLKNVIRNKPKGS